MKASVRPASTAMPDAAGTDRRTQDRPAPTADRLRDEIDRGGAADKVAVTDPAAAPLGTDDEAAGTPPTAEQVQRARDQELHRSEGGQEARKPPASVQPGPSLAWVLALAGIAAVAVAAILYVAG